MYLVLEERELPERIGCELAVASVAVRAADRQVREDGLEARHDSHITEDLRTCMNLNECISELVSECAQMYIVVPEFRIHGVCSVVQWELHVLPAATHISTYVHPLCLSYARTGLSRSGLHGWRPGVGQTMSRCNAEWTQLPGGPVPGMSQAWARHGLGMGQACATPSMHNAHRRRSCGRVA